MKDVLFYNNYSPVGDVCTIAIGIIYWILLNSTYTIKQKNLLLFKTATVFVMVASASGIVYHELIQEISHFNKLAIYVTRFMIYMSLGVIFALYITYIKNLIEVEEKESIRIKRLMIAGLAVFSIFEILSPITKIGFWIDKDLGIHQNYYYEPFRFMYVYNMGVIGYIFIKYRRKFIVKMYNCMVAVTLLSFAMMSIQAYFLQTSYTCITFTFPIMAVLFLFHYNPYDSKTGTLDFHAFNGYVEDMADKKFSMIFLYLQGMKEEKMDDLSEEFIHFNEKYFRGPCTFRLKDDKMVMVYLDEKNKDADRTMSTLLEDFEKLYLIYKMEYKIVWVHSNELIKKGDEYLALNEYVESKMTLNSVYQCISQDVNAFITSQYIVEQLQDISEKQDLDDERVKVYCQPVYNTETTSFTTAEALMRIELDKCGMIFPDFFIGIAEKNGYIHNLSKIILNKTCKAVKKMLDEGYCLERISVNFSVTELRDKNFGSDIVKIIKDANVPYEKIAIELTESKNTKDYELVKNMMTALQEIGIKFYLDDFGTGYSNFERIIGLPIDIIKFDRTFTRLAAKNEESRYMVGSFADIFKNSNYQILFEGVEDEMDEERCKEMNATYLQGYKYSKPIPIEDLRDFLPMWD